MGRTHAAGYRAASAAGLPVTLLAVTGPREVETPEGADRLPDAAAQRFQRGADAPVELHLVGQRRELDERAVDIEE